MTVSRALIGPFARERAGRPSPHLRLVGAPLFLILMSTPAEARHCPRGEIWMIHARQCVGRHAPRHAHLVPEEPSHHGIVYVHVVEPPPKPPEPPAPPRPVEIPYELPHSIMSHAYKPAWVLR